MFLHSSSTSAVRHSELPAANLNADSGTAALEAASHTATSTTNLFLEKLTKLQVLIKPLIPMNGTAAAYFEVRAKLTTEGVPSHMCGDGSFTFNLVVPSLVHAPSDNILLSWRKHQPWRFGGTQADMFLHQRYNVLCESINDMTGTNSMQE